MRLRLLPLLGCGLLLPGCWESEDNARIHVKNRTDRTIEVRYDQEYVADETDTDGDGFTDTGVIATGAFTAWIAPGDEKRLWVDDFLYRASIDVRYGDQWRHYETEVDLLGYGTIWVRQEHFESAPALPVGNG